MGLYEQFYNELIRKGTTPPQEIPKGALVLASSYRYGILTNSSSHSVEVTDPQDGTTRQFGATYALKVPSRNKTYILFNEIPKTVSIISTKCSSYRAIVHYGSNDEYLESVLYQATRQSKPIQSGTQLQQIVRWLNTTFAYSDIADNDQSIIGTEIYEGNRVCRHLAGTAHAIFLSKGIDSELIAGNDHAFLRVNLSRSYWVDPTWGFTVREENLQKHLKSQRWKTHHHMPTQTCVMPKKWLDEINGKGLPFKSKITQIMDALD